MHQKIARSRSQRLKALAVCAVLLAFTTTPGFAVSFVVTNLNDDGPGSFRKALNDARRDDTIDFAVTGTIVVSTFPLGTAATNLVVRGPGADRLVVSGNGTTRVFSFSEASVVMSGLTIRDGDSTALRVFNIRGGGIMNESTLTLNDCAIINNTGGGIHNFGIMEMNRCTVSNNRITSNSSSNELNGVSRAAAIVNDGDLTISHSTIADNEAINEPLTNQDGSAVTGGILHGGRTLNIIGCTIAGNSVTGIAGGPAGGGIVNFSIVAAPMVTDTIIAGNRSPMAPDCFGSFASGGYNLIGDKEGNRGFTDGLNRDQVGGEGRPAIDARLGELAHNGGPTFTKAVLAGSPAIDQGLSSLPTDQRGAARRFDVAGTPNAEGGDGSDVGAFELRTDSPGALLNISTRAQVEQGENVLIGGFIISGSDPKRVLLRAIGPSLSSRGVQGALQNPTLDLFRGNELVTSNNDWKQSQQAEIEATGIPPTNDAESAIIRTLSAGTYTAIVRGVNNSSGVALVEAYDLDQAATSRLGNLSTRAFVQTGEKVLIGGVIVGPVGSTETRVLVRAIGPSLSAAGVSAPLQDPTLELFDGNGAPVAANDNWKETQQAEIAATGIPPSDDRESAILRSLRAGNYTAVVRGKAETTGVGLVEVYNVQ
ncbi:MAG: hypothetical protein AVDCRST_MAG42-2575 [uncultured Chthoniobacterales bacterium]|uniref:Right handed beta helix domain-containing protein n=1 Tax=uncultured Chthoniobacterales bacterium TaxID=1836801 RepID=A0A6J4INV5_9BACT|nr:MAG: hypothetical protein AVDCRST_MAG42-2575 [uncultured Chthoniobacterales bacterium]